MSTVDLTAGSHLPLRGLPRPVPYVGPVAILGVIAAWVLMWAVSGPAGASTGSYVGQAIGSMALLLMSTGLLLAGLGPQLERWFGGLDKTVVWHRGLSFFGFLLLFPHGWLAVNPALAGEETVGVMLGSGARFLLMVLMVWALAPPLWRSVPLPARRAVGAPFRALGRLLGGGLRRALRAIGGYDGWRSVHRFAALAVAMGFVHGLLTATMFGDRPLLRWTYLVAGAIGLVAYLARLVLGSRLDPRHEYRVASVTTTGPVTELVLAPEDEPLRFEAGQFAFVRFPGRLHRHPLTIASAPGETVLRFSVKALGDYTATIGERMRTGDRVTVQGPYGHLFDDGDRRHQVWVAAGVGVTPMLGRLRSRAQQRGPRPTVDLFYSTRASVADPFAAELAALAHDDSGVRLHVVDTATRERLTVEEVAEAVQQPDAVSVVVVGPDELVTDVRRGMRRAGVPVHAVRTEVFNWR